MAAMSRHNSFYGRKMEDKKPLIDRFTKESGYEFLSNFHPSTVRFEGALYPTLEHAYQAAKTIDIKTRETIRKAKSPFEAKKLGHAIPVREDWLEVRLDIMRTLVREKFENPFLRPMLLGTGEAELVLNNKWNDTFWGVCRDVGENWLGKILVEERDRIRKEDIHNGAAV
jgi:ribA/ribD-fused uncharacterized protein